MLINGPSEISTGMLKHTAASITPSITKFFNLSLRTGSVPSEGKQSLVAPIPKTANYEDLPNNYIQRPSKLLDRCA